LKTINVSQLGKIRKKTAEYDTYRVTVLSGNYLLSLPVGLLIVFMYPTKLTAHMGGKIAVGSDNQELSGKTRAPS
jgi:hypothetical protein